MIAVGRTHEPPARLDTQPVGSHQAADALVVDGDAAPGQLNSAETIALPQREYKRILGYMPENLKQRNLVLGGESGQRRLYVYVIGEGVSF